MQQIISNRTLKNLYYLSNHGNLWPFVFGYYPTTGFILFSFQEPTSLPMRLHVYLLHDNPEGKKKKKKKTGCIRPCSEREHLKCVRNL